MKGPLLLAGEVIDFWFAPTVEPLWFKSTPAFDNRVTERFLPVYQAAAANRLQHWVETPVGALALVIVLDQLPLNMFRGQPASFATEQAALAVAKQAVARSQDLELSDPQKAFLYMPYMHSESLADQDQSVALYEQAGLDYNLKFARHHRDIVARFGRFPHRNAILGRESSADEVAYLASAEGYQG